MTNLILFLDSDHLINILNLLYFLKSLHKRKFYQTHSFEVCGLYLNEDLIKNVKHLSYS